MTGSTVTTSSPRVPSSGPVSREPLAVRHPVSTFVALLAVAALLLGAVAATGAVVPRAWVSGWDASAPTPHHRIYTVEVHNDALAPLEVRSMTWPTRGLDHVEVLVVRPGGRGPDAGGPEGDLVPFAPFTLDGGRSRVVVLRGDLSCPSGALHATVEVGVATLAVATALGVARDVVVRGPVREPGRRSGGPDDPWVESAPCP